MVNEIVSYLSDLLLVVYRNATDFCVIFHFYWVSHILSFSCIDILLFFLLSILLIFIIPILVFTLDLISSSANFLR